MAHREYSMDSESKKTTKVIEEHCDINCIYCMKRSYKNGYEVYVWFRICSCAKTELKDRSEEYDSFSDGDSLPQSYSKNGIDVHYAEACTYRALRELPDWNTFKIEEECHCEKRLPKGRSTYNW